MKKFITLIIAIFMLMAIITACDKNEATAETSETTSAVETTVEETEDTTAETEEETSKELLNVDISIFKDGKSEFTIVQPESTNSDISKAGTSLKNAIKKQGGTSINFYKEGMYKTLNGGTMDGHKIVIGVLEEDEISRDIFESFDGYYYPYTIKVVDGSLYIVGGSTEATVNAINYFIDTYLSDNITSLELEKDMSVTIDPEPPIANLTINGNSIYDYSIVYFQSYYAEQTANSVKDTLIKMVGKELPVIEDSKNNPEKELEILIGKTSREESKALRAEYERPNVYYDIVEANGKLVIMGEGYTTLDTASNKFSEYMETLDSDANIVGGIAHGDVIDSDNMLERAEGTDIRTMAWNMGAPAVIGRVDLWEKQADVILMHLPDVLGTTEFYDSNSEHYKPMFDYVMKDISEYYTFIDSPVDTSFGEPNLRYGKTAQNILYRKGSGLSVSDSGFRFISPPDNLHGCHWAIFEKEDGNKFIYSMAHYSDSHQNPTYPTAHMDIIDQVQAISESNTLLPVIFAGDLFMYYGGAGYSVVPARGYKDAQRDALVNANNNITHATNHGLGIYRPSGAMIDLIFYNAGFEALKFKVVVTQPALDSSDHNPVVADFRF